MTLIELLARERRARLGAERLLEQRNRQLFAAHEKLVLQGRAIGTEVVRERSAAREAEALKGQQARFMDALEVAHTGAVMAERRLRDSIDAIRDGFAVFDADFRLVIANEAWLASFEGHPVAPGITQADILRIACESGLIEVGEMAVEEWVAALMARWEMDPIPPQDVRLSNGRWVRLVERRARDGDIVSLALDITDQTRILAAIEAIPDGFVLFDRDSRVIMANRHYAETMPGLAGQPVQGMRLEDILRRGLEAGAYPEAAGREDDWLSEQLDHHAAAEGEMVLCTDGGRWLKAIDRPTPDGGRVGLRLDITEERRQQEALMVAREAAEAANRAKSAFLANMSHEIRTPMNGVVGMAELLCATDLTEDQRLYAETIRSSGEALLLIINDILDYSKLEAERLSIHAERFDLERTIHEVAMLLQPEAREKGLDLLIDFDMFLPTRYLGDAGRLRQVLTNLLGNAVKFTEAGHVLIRVVGIETDAAERQLHVTVEDTGIGIAPDQLPRIFDEFSQVESTANRKFGGTGLGLAISRRLIARMGGEVWVDSEPGRGSCFGFRVTLPVAEEEATPALPVGVARALIVDDRFLNRTILERQLATCGISATLCHSGAEALAVLAGDPRFDVALVDDDMPGMPGLMLAEAIRAARPGLPVVLLSASPATVRASPGADDLAAILQKPVLRAELYARLRTLHAPAGLRRMRVLAAEDNRTNQLVLRRMVKDLAIDLTFAADGNEAVTLWREFRPDLILMDISMPGMDGLEAAAAIRMAEAGGQHVPIIALTAHAVEEKAEEMRAAGIDRFLAKPFRRIAIAEVISEHCPPGAVPVTAGRDEE